MRSMLTKTKTISVQTSALAPHQNYSRAGGNRKQIVDSAFGCLVAQKVRPAGFLCSLCSLSVSSSHSPLLVGTVGFVMEKDHVIVGHSEKDMLRLI